MCVENYMTLTKYILVNSFVFHLQEPGYVGFANLPNQVHRKSVKKGFEFTLMVVGKCYDIGCLFKKLMACLYKSYFMHHCFWLLTKEVITM